MIVRLTTTASSIVMIPRCGGRRLPTLLASRFGVWGAGAGTKNSSTTGSTTSKVVDYPMMYSSLRSFSTTPTDKKNDDDDTTLQMRAKALAEVSATGIGQVIFLNSPQSGAILLGGLAVGGGPYLASLAALGTITAHLTAQAIQLDKGALENGLWSYNGCLVGCAMAVFGPSSIAVGTTSTLIGAACTPLVSASLKEVCGSMPQWTFAFNVVTLTSLLRTQPFAPPVVEVVEFDSLVETEFLADLTAATTTTATTTTTTPFVDLLVSPLTGVSQIFVVESALSGAIIAGGIARYSPGLAAHAVAGSALGMVTGAFFGAPLPELAAGLWGFNSALTSMAIGVFFVHSTPTMILSAGGAVATAATFGFMKVVFGAYSAPCLTLPFCFTMSACYLSHKQVPSLVLAASPHSPEKNAV